MITSLRQPVPTFTPPTQVPSAVVTYLFGDHLGSTSASLAPDDSASKQGYFAFGGGRYNGGTLSIDYAFVG